MSKRAQRVLDAMRTLARRDIICETTGRIAAAAGCSADTVLRGIHELVESGHLDETGLRRGKARAFRIVESPRASVESPQHAAHEPTAGAPLGVPMRSSMPAQDDAPLSYELRRDFADRARELWARFSGISRLDDLAKAEPGLCDECSIEAAGTFVVGKFKVCLACAVRRVNAAARVAVMATFAERSNA